MLFPYPWFIRSTGIYVLWKERRKRAGPLPRSSMSSLVTWDEVISSGGKRVVLESQFDTITGGVPMAHSLFTSVVGKLTEPKVETLTDFLHSGKKWKKLVEMYLNRTPKRVTHSVTMTNYYCHGLFFHSLELHSEQEGDTCFNVSCTNTI